MSASTGGPASGAALLRVAGVHAGYGDVTVLRGVDIEVGPGESVALLGANGCGKTTLLKTVIGMVAATAGRIEVDGAAVRRPAPAGMVRRGVVLVPEGRRVFAALSVEENLRAGAYTAPANTVRERLREAYAMFPVLADKRAQHAGLLSGGQQQMLAIARGLMSRPRVLLLDEPSLGLAPRVVDEVAAGLAALRETGTAVLLVEQNVGMAEKVAGRAYVLEAGRVVASGAFNDLMARDVVARVYLGATEEGVS